MQVLLRVTRTPQDGAICTGVVFERRDGGIVVARDLRVPVGQLMAQLPAVAPWAGPVRPAPRRPRRPGPKGHPAEHWQTVAALWERAQQVAPRSPIAWMRAQWSGEPVSDATMRRWRDRALSQPRTGDPT